MAFETVFTSGSGQDWVTNATREEYFNITSPSGSNVASLNQECVGPLFNSYQLLGVNAMVVVAGSTSAALMVGKCTGSTPAGSATPLLTAVVMLTGSADQPYILRPGTGMVNSAALQTLQVNDRLVAQITGLFNAPAQILVGFNMQRI